MSLSSIQKLYFIKHGQEKKPDVISRYIGMELCKLTTKLLLYKELRCFWHQSGHEWLIEGGFDMKVACWVWTVRIQWEDGIECGVTYGLRCQSKQYDDDGLWWLMVDDDNDEWWWYMMDDDDVSWWWIVMMMNYDGWWWWWQWWWWWWCLMMVNDNDEWWWWWWCIMMVGDDGGWW